jgi:hypothetical protein
MATLLEESAGIARVDFKSRAAWQKRESAEKLRWFVETGMLGDDRPR